VLKPTSAWSEPASRLRCCFPARHRGLTAANPVDPAATEWRVEIAIFVLSAVVSLTASLLLVSRLERVGERLGVSEALLGLLAALAADSPEITSSVTAIAGGHGTVGIGVTLGSNVFNLAALFGLSALIAGRIEFRRRAVILEGVLGLWIALLSLAVVAFVLGATFGLLLALVPFVPYVAYSAVRPTARRRVRLPRRWSAWLARALAEEESELAAAIRPRRGDRRDVVVVVVVVVVVIVASVAMEETATSFGLQAGLPPIVIGGLILAAVTSLPNAVAAVYLASRGRGAATLSTAFNSNALNVIVGLLIPAVVLGLGTPSRDAGFVALAYSILTAATVLLALRGGGVDRRAGSIIIAGYLVFAVVLATR
jgi:cation:H+ antiporter